MCGIVGVTRTARDERGGALQRTVDTAVASMRDRGPDHQASIDIGWAVLGHTRLSILDLDKRSNQPMVSPCGRWHLTYNGEIFNYRELRSELIANKDWIFQSEGDTEVVLAALITWGPAAFARFNGMWALALTDNQDKSVLLSRDRFGVKPLYWSNPEGACSLAFASTLVALQLATKGSTSPDLDAVAQFLTGSVSHFADRTFLLGYREFPTSSYALWQDGRCQVQRYWDYPESPDPVPGSDDELEHLLHSATALRQRSDVPVVITLSGGLDSSLIAAMAVRQHSDVSAFTARFRHFPNDESSYAATVATELGIPWHPIDVDVSRLSLNSISSLVRQMDGPNASPAALALREVMGAVREYGGRVALEGQGADELLGGYSQTSVVSHGVSQIRTGHWATGLRTLRDVQRAEGFGVSLKYTARAMVPAAGTLYRKTLGVLPCLSGSLREAARAYERPWLPDTSDLQGILQLQMTYGLRPLLHYGDRMSMANSVESRQPFLDYRLVEFAFRMPFEAKVENGRGKAPLRRIAKRLLPTALDHERPKLGFPTPVAAWVNQPDARDAVLNGALMDEGVLSHAGVTRLYRLNATGARPATAAALYRLLTTEMWWRSLA